MSARAIPSALGIEPWLRDGLEHNLECLFTVAYLTDSGVQEIEDVIRARLQRPRFRLRILFRDVDLITEPDALVRLLRCARRKSGSIELRYAKSPDFHAKAYGFKGSRSSVARPSVLVGSANLTAKAIGTLSGEMSVVVPSSVLGASVWDEMETFWDDGERVTPAWLKAYRRAFEANRSAVASGDAARRGWAKRRKKWNRKIARLSAEDRLWVEHVAPAEEDLSDAAKRGRSNAIEAGLKVPSEYLICRKKRDAFLVPQNQNVLEVFWRNEHKAEDGLISIKRIRFVRPTRVTDPKTKTQLWLLGGPTVRGSSVTFRKKDNATIEAVLRKMGRTWGWLDNGSGYANRIHRLQLVALVKRLKKLRRVGQG